MKRINWRRRYRFTILLLLGGLMLWISRPVYSHQQIATRSGSYQQFDAAATVTALVQLRDAIIATLTAAPTGNSSDSANNPATPTPALLAATATIKVRDLNLRAGPGTQHSVLTTLKQGTILTLLGRNSDCAWVKVTDGRNTTGWVSGSANFVTLSVACSRLEEVGS